MKYGVVFWQDTDNIGDHIQTYAACSLIPQVDYIIDRERMNFFQSYNNENVAVIMNGWFLHNKFNFPPNSNIVPLCMSMHFSEYDYYDLGYSFLEGEGAKWLKKNGPIGCRDYSTLQACLARGIEAYLSGCLTLTLPAQPRREMAYPYICAVDLPDEDVSRIKKKVDKNNIWVIAKTHRVYEENGATSFQDAMNNVEELLTLYQNAHCVVTTRLHCALPCLAMGVPVLLVLDYNNEIERGNVNRFDFFLDLLHVVTPDDFTRGEYGFSLINPPTNKPDYMKYREQLINTFKEFILNISDDNSDNLATVKTSDKILEWQNELREKALLNSSKRIQYLLSENKRIFNVANVQQSQIRKMQAIMKRKKWKKL